MNSKDTFSGYHPSVNFLFFTLTVGFSMFFMHYICIIISFLSALSYSIYLNRPRSARFYLRYMLPMFLLAALINPAFSHQGATILTYLPGGNPLTLESILYGAASAAILITVIAWFSCFNAVMGSDKLVYLFGRAMPALSILLTLSLRFIPRFSAQLKVISAAQKCIGRDASSGGVLKRARNGITILSIMVTWALENAVETADSMKNRGYGLKGRTAFSIYRFDKRDRATVIFMCACAAYVLAGRYFGALYWRFYPLMRGAEINAYSITVFAAYFALMFTPVTMNIREDRKWKALQSKT